MRKEFLIFIFIFIYPLCYAQNFKIYEGDTINKTDINKLKQGNWIYFNDEYKGNISQKGNYIDNKKDDLWVVYYQNGNIKSQIYYKNNKQFGEVNIFYSNGNIQEQGYWKINRWVGEYYYFFENGNVKYHWFFDEQGKRTGKQTYLYENGKTQIEGDWLQGKEKGEIKEYYATGQLKKVSNFENGDLNGSVAEYYADGQLKSKSIYVSGVVDETQSFAYAPKNNSSNSDENNINNENDDDNTPEIKTFTGTGFYKFVNDKGLVEREGTFQNGILIEGKRFVYDETGKKLKTIIIEGGRVVRVEEE